MQIQLSQFFIRNLQFDQIPNPADATGNENEFEFGFVASFYSQRNRDFFVEFHITLQSQKDFICKFSYVFLFATDDDITLDFIKSPFPIINAPAIAFPYIRTFVSNLSLNAGYPPIILPSVNFLQIEDEKRTVYLDGALVESVKLISK
ncbi:MAG: protein-export chaperone SecB [Bacteroidota bacterium]